jgi:coenzyme PQQ synthesis protein D (PqqD)
MVTGESMRYELAADVVVQVADAEALLVKLNDENMFALNATGTEIVRAIAGGTPVDALVAQLADTYAAVPADVERDVKALVAELVQRGLLMVTDERR